MAARVNDAVHVQVEIVEFPVVWVGRGPVDGEFVAIVVQVGKVFDDGDRDFRVLLREPAEQSWDAI